MNLRTVGIGEYIVSSDPEDIIKTYALGSCSSITVWDPLRIIGGLNHIALPEAKINPERAAASPGYFADTGIPAFFDELIRKGLDPKRAQIKIMGGANVLHADFPFDIGKRNVLAIRKILWRMNLAAVKEDVGGTFSRTVSMHVGSGEVILNHNGKNWNL